MRTPSAAKGLLLALGLLSLGVGLKAAWGSDSGSLAILVGAALVALALLDVTELELRHHDSELYVALAQELEETVRESPELNESEDLAELREKLLAIAARAKLDEPTEIARSGYEIYGPNYHGYQSQRHLPPAAYYALVRDYDGKGRRLHIYLRWWGAWMIVCRVTSPEGHIAREVFYGLIGHQGVNFPISYPDSFAPSTPPVTAGEYEVAWLRAWDPSTDNSDENAKVLSVEWLTITPEMLESVESWSHLQVKTERRPSKTT